jgi:hypothetical protein
MVAARAIGTQKPAYRSRRLTDFEDLFNHFQPCTQHTLNALKRGSELVAKGNDLLVNVPLYLIELAVVDENACQHGNGRNCDRQKQLRAFVHFALHTSAHCAQRRRAAGRVA